MIPNRPQTIKREDWNAEFVALLLARMPEFAPEQARLLAEGSDTPFEDGDTPQEALDAEMECWTDDCPDEP